MLDGLLFLCIDGRMRLDGATFGIGTRVEVVVEVEDRQAQIQVSLVELRDLKFEFVLGLDVGVPGVKCEMGL